METATHLNQRRLCAGKLQREKDGGKIHDTENVQALARQEADMVQFLGYAVTRDHGKSSPPPTMQGLRYVDISCFVEESQKWRLPSERDGMSVLSDEESVGSVLPEEGKEARRRTENLSATFA